MKKVLIWLLVILLLAAAAYGGWYWYRETHIFIEDAVYAKNSESLDLRGTGISLEHYDSLQAQLPTATFSGTFPSREKAFPATLPPSP